MPATVMRIGPEQPLGAALNRAAAAGGTLLEKMDDDDAYGSEHPWDLVLAHEYSQAHLVGKTPRIHRGVHRLIVELEQAIVAYIEAVNENPKPFRWHKSVDEILASIKRFRLRTLELAAAQSVAVRTSESGH